jgi:hypothetical protein
MNALSKPTDLFGVAIEAESRYPDSPGFRRGSDPASREAARAISPIAAKMRAKVLREFCRLHPAGGTSDEIASRLGISILSARPRASELRRLGYLEPLAVMGRSSTGHAARILRATSKALAEIGGEVAA